MRQQIKTFLKSSSGVTAIEYALLAGLISVVIVVSVGFAGGELLKLFNLVKDQIVQANK